MPSVGFETHNPSKPVVADPCFSPRSHRKRQAPWLAGPYLRTCERQSELTVSEIRRDLSKPTNLNFGTGLGDRPAAAANLGTWTV
jgi:hypothetical protein